MGLAERKAVQSVKESDFSQFTKNVAEICGFAPNINFSWSDLENNSQCIWIVENKKHNSYMFDRVTEALRKICGDEMGKSAVKQGLKELNLVPKAGDLDYKDGTFTISNDLTGNGAYDAQRIQEFLEKHL